MAAQSEETLPWRMLLLPHERWIARRLLRRYARLDSMGRPATKIEIQHGRLGLVVFTVAMLQGVIASLVGICAVFAIVITRDAPALTTVVWVCVIVDVYAFSRGCQAALMRPGIGTDSKAPR